MSYGRTFPGGTVGPPVEYALTPDPGNVGLFLVPPGFVEDPANPGLWMMDGSVAYDLVESPAGSGLVYLTTPGERQPVRSVACPSQQPGASGPGERLAVLVPCVEGDC
jgi:hypothetical protein